MLKITLEVEGMRCGMCETHVNDVVRRVEGVKKVTSSHAKGRTEVIAEDSVNKYSAHERGDRKTRIRRGKNTNAAVRKARLVYAKAIRVI